MAIKNFLPTVWSETLHQQLDKQYIAVANCNRDFDGDIKNIGSVVKVCGVGGVIITDYTKNNNMNEPQELADTVQEIKIDKAKCFNFQIDDIDRAQASPKLMEAAMKNAASALADEADVHVLSLFENANNEIINDDPDGDQVVETIIRARQTLYENNVGDNEEVVVEVSPAVACLLLRAKINMATDNATALEHGCLGSIAGCKVYVSNNIKNDDDGDFIYHFCGMRTKRAIAFAEQISDIEAYRPEKRFADAVKGLHLYGTSILYPNELVLMKFGFSY